MLNADTHVWCHKPVSASYVLMLRPRPPPESVQDSETTHPVSSFRTEFVPTRSPAGLNTSHSPTQKSNSS